MNVAIGAVAGNGPPGSVGCIHTKLKPGNKIELAIGPGIMEFDAQDLRQIIDELIFAETKLYKFRTKLKMRCRHCGFLTNVYTTLMVCQRCGSGYEWICHRCHKSILPNEAELCGRCRFFICPECGSCGCDYKPRIGPGPATNSRIIEKVAKFL